MILKHRNIRARLRQSALASILAVLGINSLAQPATRPIFPPAADEDARQFLGQEYVSPAAGIQLRPPINATVSRRAGIVMDEPFVAFSNKVEQWELKVLQYAPPLATVLLREPGATIPQRAPQPTARVTGQAAPALTDDPVGLLNHMESELLKNSAGITILRKEVINIGRYQTGLLASRYAAGLTGQYWLHQQAFIQQSPRHFYILDFTTPSTFSPTKQPGQQPGQQTGPAEQEDFSERRAVELFDAVLSSTSLIDTSPVSKERNTRLYDGVATSINFPKLVETMIIPQEFFLIRDGNGDLGWMIQTETLGPREGVHGLNVGILSQQRDKALARRAASEMFTSFSSRDLAEQWVSSVTASPAGAPAIPGVDTTESSMEYGRLFSGTKPRVSRASDNPNLPGIHEETTVFEQTLTVTQATRNSPPPITRPIADPFFYLPQAMGVILPRLLPLKQARDYAFVTWVSAERQLVTRYVDVQGERDASFNGSAGRYFVVKDRIGYEGEPTFHFFSKDGAYLGCHTPATGISLVASDEPSLRKRFPKDDMDRPKLIDSREIMGPGAGPTAPAASSPAAAPAPLLPGIPNRR